MTALTGKAVEVNSFLDGIGRPGHISTDEGLSSDLTAVTAVLNFEISIM